MSRDAILTDLTAAAGRVRAGRRAGAWSREAGGDITVLLERVGMAIAEAKQPPVAFEDLVDSLRPRTPIPAPATVRSALRNAELRTAFLERVGALTSAEVARVAGSTADNRHAIASRWRKDGRILGVPWGDQTLYPVFQFRDGAPHPTVARVLRAFDGRASAWEIALWFVMPSAALPGEAAPVAFLDDPSRLEAAVRSELDLPAF